ncbi:UNVERIFIED_CONTAM: hypothetical protein HDU68_008195 [Siphonaria sp. JEL0065]|nr:hypothetical protein HDU68_008195 [Siphonaria sp. JEL0065]
METTVWRQLLPAHEQLVSVDRVAANVLVAVARVDGGLGTYSVRAFDALSGFVLADVSVDVAADGAKGDSNKSTSAKAVAVGASGKTKTSDVVVLLPGGAVARVDIGRGAVVWVAATVVKNSASPVDVQVAAGKVVVVGGGSVKLLSLADGSVLSDASPVVKSDVCFAQSDAAVVCNIVGGGAAAFVAGQKKSAALDPSALFESNVDASSLAIQKLSPNSNEYIVTSGSQSVVVTLEANGDAAVVTRRHRFNKVSRYDVPVYSATTGDKRNAFVARLVVPRGSDSANIELFDVEGQKEVGVFTFPADVGVTGNVASVCPRREITCWLEHVRNDDKIGLPDGKRHIHLDTVLKDSVPTMRILAIFQDGTVSLLQQGKGNNLNFKWSRDESLAHIVDSAFVDLPDRNQFSLEHDELNEPLKESQQLNAVSRYVRRWGTHLGQLTDLLIHLSERLAPKTDAAANGTLSLQADRLGFKKLLIVATSTGKLHALETHHGNTVWSRWNGGDRAYTAKDVQVLRTGAVKYPPVVGIFGNAQGESMVHRVNALTGADFVTVDVPAMLSLGSAEQIVLVPGREEKEHANVYAVIDAQNQISLYPNTKESVAAFDASLSSFYYYRVKNGETSVKGYIVEKKGTKYIGKAIWSIDLPEGEVVADFAAKDRTEPISSLGRVLGNRSVLYKYLNPNLLALATLRETKATSNVYLYLVDTVTGSILHHSAYAGAGNAGPGLDSIFLLQVDNSILLSYFNHGPDRAEILVEPETIGTEVDDGANKRKRNKGKKAGNYVKNTSPNVKGYEITVLEVYEMPKPDARVESDTYTSLSTKKPSFLQQTFVFPHQITAIGSTRTGAGITSREILFGLSSNQLYGVNLRILDPRRPVGVLTSEDKEEMLFPYAPVIQFNPKELASHVLEVAGIKTIVSSPSTLESTSIVVAYGLDLFLARRAPSKTFDLLSEDFGYVSLIATLVSLVVGIQVAKYYAERKRVYDQWK